MIRSDAHRKIIAKVTGQDFVETTTVELQPGQVIAEAPAPGETLIAVPEAVAEQAQTVREITGSVCIMNGDWHEATRPNPEQDVFAQGGVIPAGAAYLVGEVVTDHVVPHAMLEGLEKLKPTAPGWSGVVVGPEDVPAEFHAARPSEVTVEPQPVAQADVAVVDEHLTRTKFFTMTAADAERRVRALGIPSAKIETVQPGPKQYDLLEDREKVNDLLKSVELGLSYPAYVWMKSELARIGGYLDMLHNRTL